MIIHVVRKGDTVYGIGNRYGVPAESIIQANQVADPAMLVIGQALAVPGDLFSYSVKKGDSMYSIARSFGVSLETLLAANPQIGNAARLQPGQTVTIPLPEPKLGEILVNGYVFPWVGERVLQDVLSYLTYVSVFSYRAGPDGSLSDMDVSAVLEAAGKAGTAPVMVVTNIREGAGFSSGLAHDILTDEGTQTALIGNISKTMKAKGYRVLNLDFEYLYPEDRENYVAFVARTAAVLRPQGYTVSVALAPKTSADQPGLLYEAHDYAALGAEADQVILMTYEWGYLYGPAMAVAPVNQVRRVLDYAVSDIPSEKILMGMPNYGYDWTLPFVRGSAARVLTNNGAVRLAAEKGAIIRYDPVAQAPYFHYYDAAGKRHEVWFDDPRSIRARLELVSEYGLAGVSYWTVNNFCAANWTVLDAMYYIKKLPAGNGGHKTE